MLSKSHPRHLANLKQKVKPTPAAKLRALRKSAKLRRAKENPEDGEVAPKPTIPRLPILRGTSPVRPVPLLSLEHIPDVPNGSLGDGAFARVGVVRVKRTITHPFERPGSLFALKAYDKKELQSKDDPLNLVSANMERKALHDLPWSTWICSAVDAFHDKHDLFLMLEYMPGGSLLQRIYNETGPLDAELARFYYCNIACALEFLHDHDIVYHDLKPDNILIKPDGYLCLIDFGTAMSSEDNDPSHNVGTLYYLAPEKIKDGVRRGYGVDWWASGVILYEMLTQQVPFKATLIETQSEEAELDPYTKASIFEFDTKTCITRGKYEWPSSMLVGKVLASFVSELLQVDPTDRLGCTIPVKEHPWLANVDWHMVEAHRYRASWIPPQRYFDH
ncbi:kinase-like domain-containing protein [Chiua virens]|nr:kinase-like domain-containing protein [Chiua virens]